jgi:hypothetical protein
MDKMPHESLLKVAGGISTFSGISHGLMYLFNLFTSKDLSPWLEEYIDDANIKIKNKGKKILPIETVAFITNLLSEIEEYLYLKDYSDLENKRLNIMDNHKLYENAVYKSLENHEKTFKIAKNILDKRLNIDSSVLYDVIRSLDHIELKILLENNQKNYADLPTIDAQKFKRIYLMYCEQLKQKQKISESLLQMSNFKSEYKEVAIEINNLNKYILKDSILKEYGINEKYFYQLLRDKKLLEDTEIKKTRSELFNI